jgi:hypothetical protein
MEKSLREGTQQRTSTLLTTTNRAAMQSAMDKVAQVLGKSGGKSFSRAGKMTDSLLSTKKTSSKPNKPRQQQIMLDKELLSSDSVSTDGMEKEDIKSLMEEKVRNFYSSKQIHNILAKNDGVVNTIEPTTEWTQQQQVHTDEQNQNANGANSFDVASEDEDEIAARKKTNKKKKTGNKSSHFFRSLARDDVRVGNFITSNNGFMCDNPPVGHYRPKHTIIEKTVMTPNINWARQVKVTPRRVPAEPVIEEEQAEEMEQDGEAVETNGETPIPRTQTAPAAPEQYTGREFNIISSSFDPRTGPTSMFKSKTKLREPVKPLNLDSVYDYDSEKFKYPTSGHHISMDSMLGRDQHAQSMSARTGGGGYSSGYDMMYKTVDVNVYQERMAKGILDMDKNSISRAKHRRGGRMNLEQLHDDVENRENVRYPNWSMLYDKNSTPAHLLSTSRSESGGVGHHDFAKHLGRYDTREYQKLMYTPAHANILMNTTDMVINKHANAARGAVSANQAYSKTHKNIPFLVNMDKTKGRAEFLAKPHDHVHLQYDVDLEPVQERQKVTKLHRDKKTKRKSDQIEQPKAQFYDKNHKLTEERPVDFSFSKGPDRDKHKSAFVQRSKVTLLDKFYDTGGAKETFCNPRLVGDPQIKYQLGRDEVSSKKKKKYLGQDKFYVGHVWPGGPDDTSFGKTENAKHIIDGKAYVEFSRKNELDRYEKFSTGQSHQPPVGAYDPKYEITQPRSVAVPFSKAPARSS